MNNGLSHPNRRRSSGLVRTLVVGTATFSILLVCYAMYQYTQFDPREPEAATKRPRVPSIEDDIVRPGDVDPAASTGVPVKGGVLGPGRDVKLTIYAPEGTRPRFDIEVEDWTPRPGSIDEFVLVGPRIRMRTKSGNAVRVTADEGVVEARRQTGGSLDPRRGRLTGHVLIEYDRLTEDERSEESQGGVAKNSDEILPAELVRVEVDEIRFDLEYAKVTVPGPIRVVASDAELDARDLEVRFNESENRVEWLRMARGGRIIVRGDATGDDPYGKQDRRRSDQVTFSRWFRDSFIAQFTTQDGRSGDLEEGNQQARSVPSAPSESIATSSEGQDEAQAGSADAVVHRRADGAYVFVKIQQEKPAKDQPVRYFARFEDDINITRAVDGAVGSSLKADWVEVLRDVSQQDTVRARVPQHDTVSQREQVSPAPAPDAIAEEVVLTWSGRLAVEAVGNKDDRARATTQPGVSAAGAPVRLVHADGVATGTELIYRTSDAQVELVGSDAHPAHVDSRQQGSIAGMRIVSKRDGDRFTMEITGPGSLRRTDPATSTALNDAAGEESASLNIAFAERLTARGRFVRKHELNPGTLSFNLSEVQEIDEAVLSGDVRLTQRDVLVEADELSVKFTDRVGVFPSPNQSVERVTGTGRVNMVQGSDRVTCDAIDIAMIPDPSGGARPRTAVASGDVLAVQGQRSIKASESLSVEFGFGVPVPIDDMASTAIESAPESPTGLITRSRLIARRVKARGAVEVLDPDQRLDLHADLLLCSIGESGDIENAEITGGDDSPASVRLNDLAVTGREVYLDVRDETARVPGPGRLTIQSMKDLDGRPVKEPIPIAITWTRSLDYRGKENRAIFDGAVHATSRTSTTFDCERLLVEFDDVSRAEQPAVSELSLFSQVASGWIPAHSPMANAFVERSWTAMSADAIDALGSLYQPYALSALRVADTISQAAWDEASRKFFPLRASRAEDLIARARKEPAYLLATGQAVALVTNVDPQTGEMESRARISGPKLSLNLRQDASKMLIEGPGDLLLEDYRPSSGSERSSARTDDPFDGRTTAPSQKGLLSTADSGPSNTLIEWRQSMWYDFSIEQTRFEGDVELKYLSGAALQRVLNRPGGSGERGRATFLSCDTLTIDFLDRAARRRSDDEPRMGRLSAAGLRQFDARGDVRLQDDAERLTLQADQVIYERPRDILVIYGSPQRKATIVRHEPNKLPTRMQVERMIYDLSKETFSIDDVIVSGQ